MTGLAGCVHFRTRRPRVGMARMGGSDGPAGL